MWSWIDIKGKNSRSLIVIKVKHLINRDVDLRSYHPALTALLVDATLPNLVCFLFLNAGFQRPIYVFHKGQAPRQ